MSTLIAISFKDEQSAFKMREKLVDLQKDYLIQLEDAVVVTRQDDKVKLHQALNLTATGAVSGTFWGMLIGLLFLNPLVGAAAGAGAGALGGALTDIGVNDDFMKDLGKSIQPGGSMLFVLVRSMTADKVLEALRGFGGTVIQSSLSKDQEAQLREVLAANPGTQEQIDSQVEHAPLPEASKPDAQP